MKFLFFRKIRHWHRVDKIRQQSQRGTLTLLAAFLFIVFSALGMGVLYVSQVYLKISGYIMNDALLDFASENGIKQGFRDLFHALASLPNPSYLSEADYQTLRLDTLSGEGKKLIEKLAGGSSSFLDSSWENLSWESRKEWTLNHVYPDADYFRAGMTVAIRSLGRIQDFRPTKATSLELEMIAAVGYLPLALFPFLVDQNLGIEALTEFKKENPVQIILPAPNKFPSQIQTTEEPVLPSTASSLIEKALNIDLFQPSSLTTAQLREALGLEASPDPVPEGVYLIQDDTGLGGVFVQGDCHEMVLAIEGDSQVISFIQGESSWLLRFNPAQKYSDFLTPEGPYRFESIPLGLILINGAVHSFGGGYVDLNGHVELTPETDMPCLLDGVNLTLVCADEIILSSHLILQGVKWQDGIPYVRDSKALLNIFTTGQDLIDGTDKKGNIAVGEAAPQELKIQASLTASGQGFVIEGDNKTVRLLGSLQTTGYKSGGNKLEVRWDERFLDRNELLAHNPRAVRPVVTFLHLQSTAWNSAQDRIENESM